jgi:hypothetical protein
VKGRSRARARGLNQMTDRPTLEEIGEMLAHHDRVERAIAAALWFISKYAGARPFRRSDVRQSLLLLRWRPRLSRAEIRYAMDEAFERWLAARRNR